MPIRLRAIAIALAALSGSACGSDSPDALAQKLSSALHSGDLEAANALLQNQHNAADQQLAYISLVENCSNGFECKVSRGAVTADFTKSMASDRENEGRELPMAAEGLLTVSTSYKDANSDANDTFTLPYAKVDGSYKIISAKYTAAKLHELQAKSAQIVAEEQLAVGIDGDPDWKSKATQLAADGGDPGKQLVAHVAAIAKAFKDHDYASLIALGGVRANYLYAEKDSSGAVVPAKKRQLILQGQQVQELLDVKVLGGYQQGDTAVVIIEGHNGAGWIVRGLYQMQMTDGKWLAQQPLINEIPVT